MENYPLPYWSLIISFAVAVGSVVAYAENKFASKEATNDKFQQLKEDIEKLESKIDKLIEHLLIKRGE